MSDSRRRPYLAFGGVALVVALIVGAALLLSYRNHHADQRDQAAQNEAQASADEVAGMCISLPGRDRPLCFETDGADERESYAYRDLQAQQDMAEAAAVAAYIAILMLGVTIVGVLYVARTLDTALAANAGFAEHSQRELRAYVAIESVEGVVVDIGNIEKNAITLRVNVRMRNCGGTPARRIRRTVEIFGLQDRYVVGQRLGLHASKKTLDIAPSGRFTHEYSFFVARARLEAYGIKVKGEVVYEDFSGAQWRVPYECESRRFRRNSINDSIEFREVVQFEEQRVEPQGKQRSDNPGH